MSTIVKAGGSNVGSADSALGLNLLSFAAKGDGTTIADAAITSGQTALSRASGSFTGSDAGKKVLVVGAGAAGGNLATTISSVSAGVATLAAAALTTVSGATAHYATDDSTAIFNWLTALQAQRRRGYVPKAPNGTFYGIGTGPGTIALSGVQISGDGDRQSVFKAVGAPARMLDLRESTNVQIAESLAVDGSNAAACCIDIGTTLVGASSGHRLRARVLSATDRGWDVTNCGDTVVGGSAGPFPSTATVCYWPNAGGNGILETTRWFPDPTSSAGPTRASLEISGQNIDIRGGALQGIQILDGSTCWNMSLLSVQVYPMAAGPNILGPTTSGFVESLMAIGGKLSCSNGTQRIFGGRFKDSIQLHGVKVNSGATDSNPVAFASTFAAVGASPLLIEVVGGESSFLTGALGIRWNDRIPLTGTQVTGSNQVSGASTTTGLAVGQTFVGPGFVSGTTITDITGTTITLSNTSTATQSARFTAGLPNIRRRYRGFNCWDLYRDFDDLDGLGHVINVPNTASSPFLVFQIAGQSYAQFRRGGSAGLGLVFEGLNSLVPSFAVTAFTGSIISDDATRGVVLKSPDAHYWRVTVDNTGTLATADLGTTRPTA